MTCSSFVIFSYCFPTVCATCHTCFISHIPHICHRHHRRCRCKFFLSSVNFPRMNAKLILFCVIIWQLTPFVYTFFGVNFILRNFACVKEMTNIRYALLPLWYSGNWVVHYCTLCLSLILGWRDKSAKWEPPICGCKFYLAPPRLELINLNPVFCKKDFYGMWRGHTKKLG